MVYQRQPGDMILAGQIDGRKVGQLALELGPTLPHESPVPMPRFLARRLFPQGFLPLQQPAALPVPTPEIIQAAKAVQPAPAQAPAPPANQVVNAAPQPAAVQANQVPQSAPRGWRSAAQGNEPIITKSQRIRIVERKGL